MESLTIGLLVFAIVLIFFNLLIDIYQGDFLGMGHVMTYQKRGFTPMSYAYENQEPIFQPEGYGSMGNYTDMTMMPLMKRSVDVGGIPNSELLKTFGESDFDPHLIT